MNLVKRCLSIIFVFLFLDFNFCGEAHALLGNTHYSIGERIVDKIDIDLSESEKNAFLSGMVYADIGRFKFDKQSKIKSDSTAFVDEMKKYAVTNEEKWFTRGMEMHILQDKKTGEILSNIFGEQGSDYLHYMLQCGFLDYYLSSKNSSYIYNEFLDKFNFDQVGANFDLKKFDKIFGVPEDKFERRCKFMIYDSYSFKDKNNLSTYDELIIRTYHSFGIEITVDEIQEQEANIVGVCAVACYVAKEWFPMKLSVKIDYEIERISDICAGATFSSDWDVL